MRRTLNVLLPAFLVIGAVACGGGGKGGSGPPGGSTHENGSRPVVNGWDPFAPAADPSPSSIDFPACTGEGTITVSQVIDAVLLPVCNMAATCGGSTSPPSDTPQPPGTASPADGMATRDMVSNVPPAHCEDIYESIDFDVEDEGFAGVCDIFKQVSDALKMHPECNPPLVVPEGLCIDALSTCIRDIVAMGCNPSLDRPPASCAGVSFGKSSESGGSGGSGGSPPGNGCQQCIAGCENNADCITACIESPVCAQD